MSRFCLNRHSTADVSRSDRRGVWILFQPHPAGRLVRGVLSEVARRAFPVVADPSVRAMDHDAGQVHELVRQSAQVCKFPRVDPDQPQRTGPLESVDVDVHPGEDDARSHVLRDDRGELLGEPLAVVRQADEEEVGSPEPDVLPRSPDPFGDLVDHVSVDDLVDVAQPDQRIQLDDVETGPRAGERRPLAERSHELLVEQTAFRVLRADAGDGVRQTRELDHAERRGRHRVPDREGI